VFGRFDDDALAVVEAAQREATSLGHNYLGTEHLLLGIVAAPDTAGARLVTERGVDAEGIRRALKEKLGVPLREFHSPAPLLASLGIDIEEVRRRAEATFGAETVRRVAVREARRRRWRLRRRQCASPVAPSALAWGTVRFTPRVKHTVELAAEQADRRHQPITPTHLLLGVLIEGQGLACEILADAGIDLPDLITAAQASLDMPGAPPTAN
jgi:ATP-dependent Clp protease ATP-binding subunit ClpA